jgi:hypothetical protein
MAIATPEVLRTLADRYAPLLVFSAGERVFPAQVESYLSHVSLAPSPPAAGTVARDDLGVPAETATGPHGRGTAILAGVPPGGRLGGPTAGGAPLARSGQDADAIGNSGYQPGRAPGGLFLSFAGWPDASHLRGDRDYLLAAFGELSAAMDQGLPWPEFESLPNRPVLWVDQPTAPTVYAEAQWCGDFPAVDDAVDRGGSSARDFASGPDPASLRRLLALTYHVFFPLLDGAGGGPFAVNDQPREGQWEAATVYLPASPGPTNDPAELDVSEPPVAVALSRPRDVAVTSTGCRAWGRVGREGTHARLYVSLGRHQLLFAQPADQSGNYDGPGGGASVDTRLDASDPGQDDFPGAEGLLLGLVLPWPLNLVALLLWLVSIALGMHNDAHNGENGPPPDTSTPDGDGAGSIGAPPDVAAPGTVQADGRRIDDPAPTLLRFVNRVDRDPPRTAWPDDDDPGAAPPRWESPTWWDFAGRWGVVVQDGGTDWGPGTYRIDPSGRSIGYWNTVNLTRAWALGVVGRPS